MAAINLQELEAELSRTRLMFEQWSHSMLSRANACKGTHTARMRTSKAELAALTERCQRAEKQAAQVRQQVSQDSEHEAALAATAASLASEQAALSARLQQLRREVGAEGAAAQQLAAEVSGAQAELDKRLGALQQLEAAYQSALGLRMATSPDGELQLEFVLVDARDPCRPFRFSVRVINDDDYTVTRCEPEVRARHELERLLLGGGQRDFGGFVRAMRAAFVQLAEAQAGQREGEAA